MSKISRLSRAINEASDKWTIMNAFQLFKSTKVDLKTIFKELGSGVVHAVKIDGKSAFVYGSGDGLYNHPDDDISYVQDTGSGYGKQGKIELEGYAVLDKSGNVSDEMGFPSGEKRSVWVFK
jgi:nucleoid-associated protein YgaU